MPAPGPSYGYALSGPTLYTEGKHMARIVIADDDADIRELVVFKLRHGGHEVVPVGDGAAAVEARFIATSPTWTSGAPTDRCERVCAM